MKLVSHLALGLAAASLFSGLVGRGSASLSGWQEAELDDGRDPRVLVGSVPFTSDEVERILELSPLPEPPPDPTNRVYESEAAARLGQALFFDPRLSRSGTVSCATCHDPALAFADAKPLAEGIGALSRHTMSLWNVAYNRWFFWDGRRDSLWAQALAPLEDPREHGFTRLGVAHLLAEDEGYHRAYEALFGPLPDLADEERFPPEGRPVPDEPEHPHSLAWRSMKIADQEDVNQVFANVGKSIAAYERKLVSRRSPFDVYVEGLREGDAYKQRSLTDSAKRGLRLFLGKARCHLCHSGPNFSDLEFHNDRVAPGAGEGVPDLGRWQGIEEVQNDPFNGIGRYSDDPTGEAEAKVSYLLRSGHNVGEFKTPSLRNVALTAPYMHQGQFETLAEVIEHYSTLAGALPVQKPDKLLVPVGLSDEEKEDLEDFLQSLTDIGIGSELTRAPDEPFVPEEGS